MVVNKKLLLICGMTALLMLAGCGKGVDIKTQAPILGTMEKTVEETGLVVFDDSYPISSVVNAKIITADFEEGERVVQGQVLYVLDSREIENQISQASIGLEKAKQAHRQSLAAVQDLQVQSFVTGIVSKTYCHVGDYVTAGMPVADVVDQQNMLLTVPFNQPDAGGIYPGAAAHVIMDYDGTLIEGSVIKVYDAAEPLEGGRVGVNVEIAVANPGALNQGDTAIARVGQAASITNGALRNKTQQSISATQAGQVVEFKLSQGKRVQAGEIVMIIKNDALQNAAETAALSIREIENNINLLGSRLPDYKILAPVDGVVIQKNIKQGSLAPAGTPLAILADDGKLYIEVDIDEMYIKEVAVGQRVSAVVQGFESEKYTGRVLRIDDSGAARNGVTYYKVRIALDDQTGLLEAMNMEVSIVTAGVENALMIPKKALNGKKVKVLQNGKAVEKEVTVGIANREFVQILDGLTGEEQVVVE